MKSLKMIIVVTVLFVVWLAVPVVIWQRSQPTDALTLELSQDLKQAKIQAEKSLISEKTALAKAKLQSEIRREWLASDALLWYQECKKYALGATLGVMLTTALVIGLAAGKRLSTLYVQLDEHVRIPVRHKDLNNSMPLATQFLSTKEAAALADNRQEAFRMYVQMAQTAAALNRSLPAQIANAPAALPASVPVAGPLPAFREILNALEPGDPMVLGFEQGTNKAITGGFKRIYSCGIFGLSGSGKTTGLYSIISQSLLLYPKIKYLVIDPHAQKKEGLTRGLPKTDHFEHLDPLNVRPGLTRFVQEMEARLKTGYDYSHAPRVLLIDELPVMMRGSQGQAIEAVLGRVAAEGRGVACYALISGQDTRLKAAGGNRDLLTSQIAYNLRKKQARYLFDDSDIVDLHKAVRDAKEPGLCVFNATDNAPVLMKQPLCTPQDVLYVTQLVSNGASVVTSAMQTLSEDSGDESVDSPDSTSVERIEFNESDTAFLAKIEELKSTQQWSLGELSRRSTVDKGLLSKLLNGKEKLTLGVKENLKTLLNTGSQQDSTETQTNIINLDARRKQS